MDGLCMKPGIHGVAPAISVNGSPEIWSNVSQVNAVGRACYDDRPRMKTLSAFSRFSVKHPLKSLRLGRGGSSRYNGMALDDAVSTVSEDGTEVISPEAESAGADSGGRNGSWVLKIMDFRSLWSEEGEGNAGENKGCELEEHSDDEKDSENCRVVDDEEDDIEFDRSSFSRLLRRASLAEARLFARMSYLGKLAYTIPRIKPGNLLQNLGLRFITSSLEKRGMDEESRGGETESDSEEKPRNTMNDSIRKSLSTAYDVTASAASYLYSQTKSSVPCQFTEDETSEDSSGGEGQGNREMMSSDMASLMATAESVTAVVAAKEEVKRAVADNLKSSSSSPCEWFICDDDRSGTRFFVVQGSESLASWQANLLFEPIEFEGLDDVVVHRGIYEAAKGIYEQMLPEVHAHLKSCGTRATFRFTGHSLGGSLALLINLMLLTRLQAPISSLLPVITFGAPSIMCGGDVLLRKLGLPRSHVQAVTLHRDIVPRAFSCTYPSHVAKLLKALNANFRNHRCLNSQKLLYVPMGELLILQPDENLSPNHHLLPPGSGLYLLDCPLSEATNAEKLLQAAQMVFLNSPHPLEILSDRSAYGSEGTIRRDHDMESYSKSIRAVIRQELHQIKKAKREHRHWVFRRHLPGRSGGKVITDAGGGEKFNFSGLVQRGRESLKRFSSQIASFG